MTVKKIIVMTLTLLLVVPAFVQPVAAAQPIITRFEVSGSFDDPTGGGCGFLITVEFNVIVTQKIFLDSSGTPNRFQAHIRFDATITNPDNGKFVTERNSSIGSFALPNPETFTEVGLPFRIKTAQGSTLIFDAGKIVFDVNGNIIFQGGPHPLAENNFVVPAFACVPLL